MVRDGQKGLRKQTRAGRVLLVPKKIPKKITIIQYISFNLAASKCKTQGRSILARLM